MHRCAELWTLLPPLQRCVASWFIAAESDLYAISVEASVALGDLLELNPSVQAGTTLAPSTRGLLRQQRAHILRCTQSLGFEGSKGNLGLRSALVL